jgi:hypothetical protein
VIVVLLVSAVVLMSMGSITAVLAFIIGSEWLFGLAIADFLFFGIATFWFLQEYIESKEPAADTKESDG